MSEQKDEFEEYLENILQIINNCTDRDKTQLYLMHRILERKYQEIKAKNVCKNCKHLDQSTEFKYKKCLELTDMGFDDLYLKPEEIETFSCNRFEHET